MDRMATGLIAACLLFALAGPAEAIYTRQTFVAEIPTTTGSLLGWAEGAYTLLDSTIDPTLAPGVVRVADASLSVVYDNVRRDRFDYNVWRGSFSLVTPGTFRPVDIYVGLETGDPQHSFQVWLQFSDLTAVDVIEFGSASMRTDAIGLGMLFSFNDVNIVGNNAIRTPVISFTNQPIPEPSTGALLGLGLTAFGLRRSGSKG